MNLLDFAKKQLRKRIGPPLQSLSYDTGLMQLCARVLHIEGAIVLMYHSVAEDAGAQWIDPQNHVPVDVFDEQMAFLAEQRSVIGLGELIEVLGEGRAPETGTVVITFDDGYLDNLTVAAPILEHHGLRATLFLPTGYIDRGETQWVDQAYCAFKFRTKHELTWGEQANAFELEDPEQRATGYQAVCASLLGFTGAQRRTRLEELHGQLEPRETPPRLTMTWQDVNELVSNHRCFQIGCHTMGHTDMTSVSEEEAKHELAGCAQRIEEATGVVPRYYSLPYGRTSERLRQLVAEAGFDSAFGGGSDPIVNSATDPYALPRVEAPRSMKRFDLLTSSANTGIWWRLGR